MPTADTVGRLKQSLGLPKIQPRPPCPPKIYQKLYRYLDTALPAGTKRRGRPAKSIDQHGIPTSSPAKTRMPAKATPQKSLTTTARTIGKARSAEVPSWIMPTIRQLCSKLGGPAAPPHVLAGVSSVLTLPRLMGRVGIQMVVPKGRTRYLQ